MKASLSIIAGLLGLSLAVVACGDAEEEPVPDVTVTASGSAAPIATPSPTPSAAASTPAPAPSGWKVYVDPVLGFSLSYPGDLVFQDLSGPGPSSGLAERAFQFRSPDDQRRSLSIAVVTKPGDMTLEEWVQGATACAPDTIEHATVNGRPAIRCTNVPETLSEAALIVEADGLVLFVTSVMPTFGFTAEFDSIIQSLRI